MVVAGCCRDFCYPVLSLLRKQSSCFSGCLLIEIGDLIIIMTQEIRGTAFHDPESRNARKIKQGNIYGCLSLLHNLSRLHKV